MGRGRGAKQLSNLNSKEVLFKGRLSDNLKESGINWPEEVRAAIKSGGSHFDVSQTIMKLSKEDFASLTKLNHIDLINDRLFQTYQENIENNLQISYQTFYKRAKENSFAWNYHYSVAFQRMLFQIKNGSSSPIQVHPLRSLILNTKTNYKGNSNTTERMLLSENEVKTVVHELYHNHQDVLDDLLSEASLQSFYQAPNSRTLTIFSDNGENETKEISGTGKLNKDNACFLVKHTCEQIAKYDKKDQIHLELNFSIAFPENSAGDEKYKKMCKLHFSKLKEKLAKNPYSELENLVTTQTPINGMIDAFRINYRNLVKEKHQQVFIAALLNKKITAVGTDSQREELLKDPKVVSSVEKTFKQLDTSGETLGAIDLNNYSREEINEFLKKAADLYFEAGVKDLPLAKGKYINNLYSEIIGQN